jgi:membrane protease YdiL (CAAX protease family)
VAPAILAVIVEEILFRPLLIGVLRRNLAATRRPALWAVVLAALCWAAVHVPSQPFAMVIGLLITGLIVGGLYVFSGSNVVGSSCTRPPTPAAWVGS